MCPGRHRILDGKTHTHTTPHSCKSGRAEAILQAPRHLCASQGTRHTGAPYFGGDQLWTCPNSTLLQRRWPARRRLAHALDTAHRPTSRGRAGVHHLPSSRCVHTHPRRISTPKQLPPTRPRQYPSMQLACGMPPPPPCTPPRRPACRPIPRRAPSPLPGPVSPPSPPTPPPAQCHMRAVAPPGL
jgi:hypothetical protein